MKLIALSASPMGSKSRVAINKALEFLDAQFPEVDSEVIDLRDVDLQFSDGRNYFEYTGDTKEVTSKIMEADMLLISTPTYQASIPAALKNIFDLLPVNAFRDKVIGIIATAGSDKHYLMVEQQLKPILAYMKGHIVQKYVFALESDFNRQEIINEDIIFRIERLVQDTVYTYESDLAVREKVEAQYDF